jgi:hypothetical protein
MACRPENESVAVLKGPLVRPVKRIEKRHELLKSFEVGFAEHFADVLRIDYLRVSENVVTQMLTFIDYTQCAVVYQFCNSIHIKPIMQRGDGSRRLLVHVEHDRDDLAWAPS